ncbi:uncharacterized protein LOC112343029 isoform X1 [Selaginella moellendorffii]|uniref:uncharacterized protein LOC112343029 isoform X1 n=1 Tax=Selaginella moellendorffii TaxID=88036 RepID=UPI000D1CA0CF|nr:uncharacterized protein LOC112343029 isoform X1 [Selaginella moellendorffii]|eukprot:XP_024521590.1 uncharacterized protein LOC112343029 isoform X1 [Selaginella moellendorffii]
MANRNSSIQGPRVYVFTITILRVTRIPSPMRLSFSTSSSFRIPAKRSLKITVLHGSKQKELGEFDIVQDECLIDQRISCRLFCAKEDDLGKLHIYIDQAYSSGLAGHIALDLKEFLDDMDSEVYIKYPLCASSPREGYVPKLKMTLECTCLGNPENLFIPDLDTIIHHKQSLPSDILDASFTEGGGCSNQQLRRSQQDGAELSPEMNLLEELETVLFKLDSKLKNFVATCKTEDEKDIPVDSSTLLRRPPASAVDKGEDCSDCIVCSKGLVDKFQGLSSSLSSSCDAAEVRCSKDFGSNVAEEEEQKVETRQRPNMLRNVFGGALLVGLSIFAATSLTKRERPLWRPSFSTKRGRASTNPSSEQ